MHKTIRRVAVIGAGVMGAGIAAHLANAGLQAVLLDIVPPTLSDKEKTDKRARNKFSQGGLDNALKSRPAAFFAKQNATLVEIGNTEDDLAKLNNCDLVIEAIIEKLDVKQALFEKLEKILPEHAIVASNTSGLRIHDMMKGRSEGFKKRFLVMHFFNPVRYMKLLELVVGPDTDPKTADTIAKFGRDVLGKGIVFGKDTPNFVGNRIGTHAMMGGIHQMIADGLAPEDVDAITGNADGAPEERELPHRRSRRPRHALARRRQLLRGADRGRRSRRLQGSGIHPRHGRQENLGRQNQRRLLQTRKKQGNRTYDPKTESYRPKGGDEGIKAATKSISKIEDPKERVKKLVADPGKAGSFAWKVLSKSLAYSARRLGEIADSITAIDDAMKWGYNWELGPFEVWDALGFVETLERMQKDGINVPDSILKMKSSGATSFYKRRRQRVRAAARKVRQTRHGSP